MKMDGSVRSGGVVKKKSSSGCLIIKKKCESKDSALVGGSSHAQLKKRPRLAVSSSSSSDEDQSLELFRRKVIDKRMNNGSMGYTKSRVQIREYDRNNCGMENKRNSLDLFEFDEYDEFDEEEMRKNSVGSRLMAGHGNLKKFGVGPSNRNVVADKRKQNHFSDDSVDESEEIEGSMKDKNTWKQEITFDDSSCESEGMQGSMRDKRIKSGDNEPIRLKRQEISDEPIRLQGKNGVLKVMMKKKKKLQFSRNYEYKEVQDRKNSSFDSSSKKDSTERLPSLSVSNPSNQGLRVVKNAIDYNEKKETKFEKRRPFLIKDSKARGSEINGIDITLKSTTPGSQASTSKKVGIKMEEEKFLSPVNTIPVKGKDGKGEKSKKSGSTEKQLLREKIRKMLVDAGWTIDYRPRRNRDYLDAVYINPCGTAYWSIIKAYDAFRKQLEEVSGKSKLNAESPSFAPLSEDLLNKLTRQTKKKIKEEMKRKRKVDHESEDLSDESSERKPRKVRVEKSSLTSDSNIIEQRSSKVIGRCTLLARGSNKAESSYSDGYVPYNGKRTVLSWLIDSGTAKSSEKVQYINRRRNRVMLEGWITRDGIHCSCCSKILTVSKFELHAGSKLRQPFQNIYLESGESLLQCQTDAWNRQEEPMRCNFHSVDVDGGDPDDDTCGNCGDGGDLICCDSCPSTFHQLCLDIKMLPSGDWHCPNCTCRYCGEAGASDIGNAGEEPIKCSCCEKKYHKSCSERVNTHSDSYSVSLCGQACQQLYDHIQKILGIKHELEAGFSWSLVQRTDVSDTSHRNFAQKVECNSKLAVALSVMNECFLPIFDRRSGINMMNSVVYNCGSNFNRLNYSGFYTAILERGDEIISAASIRIHGTRLAEMPFIGTREIYRRQGMCRRLLSAIETALESMGVEKLIIPAISEHTNTWTTIFSFHPLEDLLKKEIKSMNMLVFPGTDMLQKQLVKQELREVSEAKKNQLQPSDFGSAAVDSSLEHNSPADDNTGVCPEIKIDDNVGSSDSSVPDSPTSTLPSNDAENGASDPQYESDVRLANNATTMIMSEETNEHEPSFSGNSSSETEDVLPHAADNKTNSSMETSLSNACKMNPKASCVEESARDSLDEPLNTADSNGNQNQFPLEGTEDGKVVDSTGKAHEDAAPKPESTDDGSESVLSSDLAIVGEGTAGEANGEEPIPASLAVTVSTEPFIGNELNAHMEPSYDSTATTSAQVECAMDTKTVTDPEGDEKSNLASSYGVESNGVIASSDDMNGNPILNSSAFAEEAGEITTKCEPEIDSESLLSAASSIEVDASADIECEDTGPDPPMACHEDTSSDKAE